MDEAVVAIRNEADVKFALAASTVDRIREEPWDPDRSPALVESAGERLTAFIEDAQRLGDATRTLAGSVPPSSRLAYETAATILEARILEAEYLKELVRALALQLETDREIGDAHVSCLVITDELSETWESRLEQAIEAHQAGIALLSDAEESIPQLSARFSGAVAQSERLIEEAAALRSIPAPALAGSAADDHGDSISDATSAAVPCSIRGYLGTSSDQDYFAFPVASGKAYSVAAVGGSPGDFSVYVYNAQGRSLASGQSETAFSAAASETAYAMVRTNRGTAGAYALTIAAPDDDHGNTTATATEIEPDASGSSAEGAIEYVGDYDYFTFDGEEGKAYLLSAAGTPGDYHFEIYDAQGQRVNSGYRSATHTATASGSLYVAVRNAGNNTGSYTFTVTEPEDDYGNSIDAATAVGVPSSTEGSLEYAADQDFFSVTTQVGKAYVFSIGSVSHRVAVFDAQARQLAGDYRQVTFTATESKHYVSVGDRNSSPGAYVLSVSAPSDDHGNAVTTASRTSAPGTVSGSIQYARDLDYLEVPAVMGTTYQFTVTGSFSVGVYDANGRSLVYPQATIAYTAIADKVLVAVQHQSSSSTGAYTLTITVPQDDHANTITGATQAALGAGTAGEIDFEGDQDYFFFPGTAGTTYMVGVPDNFYVALYNGDGRQLTSTSTSYSYTSRDTENIFVMVRGNRGTGAYKLGVFALQ